METDQENDGDPLEPLTASPEEEARRLKARPFIQLLGSLIIIGAYLGTRWIFGEPEGFWSYLGEITPFTLVSLFAAIWVDARVGHPTYGTSGALGAMIIWLMLTCAVLVIGLVVAGVSAIVGSVEVIQWTHLVASVMIGGLAILAMEAL